MKIRLLTTLISAIVLSAAIGRADSYSIIIPTGYSLIANHLDNGTGNTADQLFPNPGGALDGNEIEKWNCNGWTVYVFDSSFPTGFADASDSIPVAAPTLAPGEGAFFYNTSSAGIPITFSGTSIVPVLPPPMPCGCGVNNLVSCQTTNNPATFESIMGFSPRNGTQLTRFDNATGVNVVNSFTAGHWVGGVPLINLGESVFVKLPPCATAPSLACPTNKTVDGCSAWSFDTPTNIVDSCYTNYALTFSTFTNNAPCPLVLTRTWTIRDVCGNSNSCSQTVTVICCTNYDTNCCANCTSNNFVSYTNTIYPGYNFLANNLCQGTNDSVNSILTGLVSDPNGVMNTVLEIWNLQGYYTSYSYFTAADATAYFGVSAESGWYDSSGNLASFTLAPGDGFVLQNNSGVPYPLVIRGCPPTCPPPCEPTNGVSPILVGRLDIGPATWTNLFSCPPPCGARMTIWNDASQSFTDYNYDNLHGWVPPAPVLGIGQSVFVSVQPNTNCLPCTNNLVVNGGFEYPLVSSLFFFTIFTNGAVPGWNGYVGSCGNGSAAIELWATNGASITPAEGSQDLEISSSVANEAVCQTLTNLTPGCPATLCFEFTGRPGGYDNNFTFALSGGAVMSVPLNPPAYNTNNPATGWQQFCTNFVPTSSTLTISFSRQPTTGDVGGAHIDNVVLLQCCTNPCITLTCAGDKTVSCGVNWNFDAPTNIVDNCCTNYRIFFNAVTNNGPCPWVITGTWLVSDACGNSATCSQTVTVTNTAPTILSYPNSGNLGCNPANLPTDSSIMALITTTSGCGAITNVTHVDGGTICAPTRTFTITVSNACGSAVVTNLLYTWSADTTPPTLTCATNKTLPCGAQWSFDAPVISDNCSGTNVTLTYSTTTNGICPQFFTRTWIAADLCGNTNTCSQTVTVVSCVPPPSGMTLWLPFDESGGIPTANLFAGGNNGAKINSPGVYLGGYVGYSLNFNGVDQSVSVPDYSAINPGTGDFSIDAWVKRDPNSGNGVRIVVDKRNPTTIIGYSLSMSYGNLLFQLCDLPNNYDNYRDTGTVPADNQWHFVAVTINRHATNGGRFYIDGVATGTFDPTAHQGSLNNTNAFLVATTPLGGASPWLGGIDEVEFFLRALTPGEVQGIFNAGPAGKCKTPELVCATNKVVECGTKWSFDPPVVNTPCNGTNSTLLVLNTVTNGACPTVVTRTWLVVDGCGYTNTCSQTVSIVDTTPPVFDCPTTGPNLVSNGSFETGVPPFDLQTLDRTLSAGAADITGWTVVTAGDGPIYWWNGSDPSQVNTSGGPAADGNLYLYFDGNTSATSARGQITTIVNFPAAGTYRLEFDMWAESSIVGSRQAGFTAALSGTGVSANYTDRFYPPFSPNTTYPVVTAPSWQHFTHDFIVTSPGNATLSFTDASIYDGNAASNSLGAVTPSPDLDNVSIKATGNCCGSNKTVECGTNWTFDQPTAHDNCCSNVTVTLVASNVVYDTNCQTVWQGVWQAMDCCSNVSTCTQTVTVVDTTPPNLTCATNKTLPCGAQWSFDAPVVSDNCSGTNVTLTYSTTTNGICPQVFTRTWIATDLCGNTNICSQTVTVVSCVPPPSGMTLWLPFDESGGIPTANLFAGGNNGTKINSPGVYLGGYVGYSLNFNGVDQSVSVPDYSAINPDTGDFSIDAWVKRDPNSGNGVRIVVDKRNPTTIIGYSLSMSYGNLLFQLGDSPNNYDNYRDTGTVPADNQWHFVAVTINRHATNGGRFYIDGVATGTFDPTAHQGSLNNTNAFIVANTPVFGASPWLGGIDEVEFFLRTLTPGDVQGIFNAGPAGKCRTPELVCATNKVVECGSKWSFDPPVVNTPCNSTNSTPLVLNTVTNGACPTVVTRTWLVVDGCGYTNTCSQTVSIIDTTPPTITCPSNIVVTTCSTNAVVNYSVIATDNCCTNVTVGCYPPSGYPFPLGTTTVSCTATDRCGNVAYCSFLVTVNYLNDTTPPVFATYCTTNRITIGGNNFINPVAATPSANLLTRLHAAGIQSFKSFDQCTVNSFLAHTFNNLPSCITTATLTIRLKPCGDTCYNDSIGLSFTGAGGILSSSWGRYLGGGNPSAGLVTNNWCSYTGGQVFTFDLSALPQPNNAPQVDFISALNANGFMDLTVQDDSGVDYAILNVVSCCCATNKTVPYGTPWSFDQPTAYDAVSGTNVTITYVTYTNSLCPLVVTRVWIATDPCGNSSTCSQTIMVGQSGPCQIFNTGMTGTNGNIPVAPGLPDPNFILLSSPGAGSSCVVVGTMPVSWVTNTATSQWVGPVFDPGSSPAGVYHYQLVFILCCTNNAQMTGRMAVDDSAGLYLNGSPADSVTGFSSYTSINLTSGFVPGLNVLDIYVTNGILATGLRAELTVCAGGLVVVCPTNKVVDCGSKWSFDTPMASSCCSSNLSIILIRAGTNGICPKVASNTWLITDGCGNTNICTQMVTIRDTVAPVVFCPTNRIIVALDSNCMVHIPLIHPQASDNCTPASQLVYTQMPTNGAVLPGPCQLVTVIVSDACGNVTPCQVMVCGQDKTPPVVLYPKSITVSNCVVPNVLPFGSASDNCTSPNLLHFTQSPTAGTPIAAGGNIVTVTVTDLAGNTTTITIALVAGGANSFLNVLYNTAVNGSKVVLPNGSVDPHYTLGPVPAGTPTGVGYYNAPNAIVLTTLWGLPPFTPSEWIDPGVNAWSYPSGFYTYTNQFTLPAGANPLTASISGRWAADDGATMYLNGLVAANKVSTIPAYYGFNHWTYFTISSGILGNPTVNKLYFVVTNAAAYGNSPTGLRVEFTNAVVNCSTCTPPAIVSMTANQSRPVNSTVVFSASVSGTPPMTYQWYHNNVPLVNNGQYSGVNTPTLTITGIGYSNAGTYYICIGNPCGGICSPARKLTVSKGWPWWWAWWDFAQVGNPLAATVGPDLIQIGTNTFGISSGSTADFGLPNIGGQVANVINVQPLPGDTFIQLPFVGPPTNTSVSSYTVLMDVLMPTNGIGTNTLFEIGSSGQDSLALRAIEGVCTTEITGTVGGVPVNPASAITPPSWTWNRVALVMDQPDDNAAGDATMTMYVNGSYVATLIPPPSGTPHVPVLPIDYLADVPATVLSSPEGTSGEIYASSIQFHATAMTAEMIAGLGSPDSTPMAANDTSVGVQPVLSATTSNGVVQLSWTGSAYALQEAADLSQSSSFFDVWTECMLPFTESQVGNDVQTVAHPNPQDSPAKFYRLIFRP